VEKGERRRKSNDWDFVSLRLGQETWGVIKGQKTEEIEDGTKLGQPLEAPVGPKRKRERASGFKWQGRGGLLKYRSKAGFDNLLKEGAWKRRCS